MAGGSANAPDNNWSGATHSAHQGGERSEIKTTSAETAQDWPIPTDTARNSTRTGKLRPEPLKQHPIVRSEHNSDSFRRVTPAL